MVAEHNSRACIHNGDVQQLFPEDRTALFVFCFFILNEQEYFIDNGIHSYLGCPLLQFSAKVKKPIGLIVFMDRGRFFLLFSHFSLLTGTWSSDKLQVMSAIVYSIRDRIASSIELQRKDEAIRKVFQTLGNQISMSFLLLVWLLSLFLPTVKLNEENNLLSHELRAKQLAWLVSQQIILHYDSRYVTLC